MKLLLDISNST